uniref:Neural retina-specific leucine zipper protein n=1 Tax=Pristionchus pacificus TaxID=54126 RepID=A0A2A6CBW7_PRIPA|eukprot:PDM75674.1 maf-1 [Pristionchus pacificus]
MTQDPPHLESLLPHLSCLPPTSLPPLSPSPSSSSSFSSLNASSPSKPFDIDVNSIAGVSDKELQQLSVRQLNQRLHGQDRQVVSMLKAKRRVLKNRGYALNCRQRRMQNQAQLESDNLQLRDQIRTLRQMITDLQSRVFYYEQNHHSLHPQNDLPVAVSVMESSDITPYPSSHWSPNHHSSFESSLSSSIKEEDSHSSPHQY